MKLKKKKYTQFTILNINRLVAKTFYINMCISIFHSLHSIYETTDDMINVSIHSKYSSLIKMLHIVLYKESF